MKPDQLRKWREAHYQLDMPDDALRSMPDCASLYGNDYVAYLESAQNEAAPFVKSLMREIVWTYDNWTKAQRDSDPSALLSDIINAANGGGAEYEFVRRFLTDYARANAIPVGPMPQPQMLDLDGLPKLRA